MSALSPTSLDEATQFLGANSEGTTVVAGCTDLLVHEDNRSLDRVLDVLRIEELQGIRVNDGLLDIGAASTFFQIRENELVRQHAPALAHAAATVGGWQIQNRGTVGGNVANASPAGDSLPALMALDMQLVLASTRGTRTIPYAAYHTGYRQTVRADDELIVRIQIPIVAGRIQTYRKVGTRHAQAISKVVVGFSAVPRDGVLTRVRFAAGSVAASTTRLLGVEQAVEGHPANAATADRAEQAALNTVNPIDDVRSTADYRRFALGRVVRRMVLDAANPGARGADSFARAAE